MDLGHYPIITPIKVILPEDQGKKNKGGRPAGGYQANVMRLLAFFKENAPCKLSNTKLVKAIGRSERRIAFYIHDLKELGWISCEYHHAGTYVPLPSWLKPRKTVSKKPVRWTKLVRTITVNEKPLVDRVLLDNSRRRKIHHEDVVVREECGQNLHRQPRLKLTPRKRVGSGRPAGRPKGLFNKGKQMLLDYLSEDLKVTRRNKTIAKDLGISEARVKRYLTALYREGELRSKKRKKLVKGTWENVRTILVVNYMNNLPPPESFMTPELRASWSAKWGRPYQEVLAERQAKCEASFRAGTYQKKG